MTVYPLLSCGHCEPCLSGYAHVCNTLRLIGIDCDGGMAEYVKVPVDKVMPIPASLPLKLGAFLEPLAVGVHAVRRSGYKPGDRVVVFGAGPIGLCVASCLKYFGATQVIVVEANAYRLGIARQLGLTTIDTSQEDVRARVKELTGGGNADFAFDCAAHPSVQTVLMDVIKVQGTAVIVGSYKKPPEVDLLKVEFKELRMIGIRVYERRDFEIATQILQRGGIDFDALLTVFFAGRGAGGVPQAAQGHEQHQDAVQDVSGAAARLSQEITGKKEMLELFSLKGKVALFTGGNRGLGQAMALGLAKAGAAVAVVARKRDQAVVDALTAQGVRGEFYDHDLADIDGIPALVARVKRDFGQIDILVNSAGVQSRHKAAEFPKADWDFVINVNMNAVFFMCQEVGRLMLAQGHGKIINISSLLAFQGGLTVPAYAASKGAVAQFTKSLANEWASRGINVNCITPGYMATEMNAALIADATRNRQILDRIPAGRWGKPEDMVGAVVYLASAASDYVNGSTLVVDGGWLGR